jgi:hypothetical protein
MIPVRPEKSVGPDDDQRYRASPRHFCLCEIECADAAAAGVRLLLIATTFADERLALSRMTVCTTGRDQLEL